MLRVNGFLDLDDYFKDIMVKNNYNFLDLVYEDYIIESLYSKGHYWLKIDGDYYYFKNTKDIYEELIVEECAKVLGIEAVSYDLAVFKGVEGVISKSYQKIDAEYISGNDILYDYLMDKKNHPYLQDMGYDLRNLDQFFTQIDLSDSIHTLEVIWQAIEYRYKDRKTPINVSKIMKKLVSMFCFNILIAQNDGMPVNWELEESNGGIELKPFYDGSDTLNDANLYPNPSMSLSINFQDKERNNYYKLEEFLKISSKEFIDIFLEMFDALDIYEFMNIMNRVENKIGRKIPQFTRRRLLNSFSENRESVEVVINKYRRGRI